MFMQTAVYPPCCCTGRISLKLASERKETTDLKTAASSRIFMRSPMKPRRCRYPTPNSIRNPVPPLTSMMSTNPLQSTRVWTYTAHGEHPISSCPSCGISLSIYHMAAVGKLLPPCLPAFPEVAVDLKLRLLSRHYHMYLCAAIVPPALMRRRWLHFP